MKANSVGWVKPWSLCYLQRFDESAVRRLPLSRRAELASNGFVAGEMAMLMNNIMNKRETVETTDLPLVEEGIQLVKRLEKGNAYLNQGGVHLIRQPESAATVRHMRARSTFNIGERTQETLSVLNQIKSNLTQGALEDLAKLNPEQIESTRAYFRLAHNSINDQLEVSDVPSSYANID